MWNMISMLVMRAVMFILALVGVVINLSIMAILGGHGHSHGEGGHDHGHSHSHSHVHSGGHSHREKHSHNGHAHAEEVRTHLFDKLPSATAFQGGAYIHT